jgi:hypothetical protein
MDTDAPSWTAVIGPTTTSYVWTCRECPAMGISSGDAGDWAIEHTESTGHVTAKATTVATGYLPKPAQ